MAEFLMPSLGADMEAGTLVQWLVAPGAAIRRGDVIAVVETQKGAIEIENFEEGVFEGPMVEIGTKVPVGSPIALVRRSGEQAVTTAPTPKRAEASVIPEAGVTPPATIGETPAAKIEPARVPPAPETPAGEAEERKEHRRPVSPAARHYAALHAIDLSSVVGSGPHGEIQLADVERLEGEAVTAPRPPVGPEPMSGMRAAIAAAMARSKREIPHYYLAHRIDLTTAEAWVADFNTRRDAAERLVVGALLAKAVALAAKKYPEFNGHFVDGVFRQNPDVHAGVAINIRGTGLVAPAIHDADALGVPELMAAMRDLVTRVRAGRFRSSELTDSTITVSSLGDRGVEVLYGVIYPPQVAIVGFGTPVTEVMVIDGLIGPRRMVHATLAGDHRVSDGHRGALFLAHIDRLLQQPEAL